MLKICVVVDKKDTAIDRLAEDLKKHMNGYDYEIVDVHPKRPEPNQLNRFEKSAQSADIIDWQYFRTAEMLKGRYDWLKDKPQLLTHHNPYSIKESDWSSYDLNIAINKSIYQEFKDRKIRGAEYIPHSVNLDYWQYNQEWKANRSVLMVANRIESKKGILPVAKACAELGVRLKLIGSISDANYFYQVNNTGAVDFAEKISNDELKQMYYSAGVLVCNSQDNFESGTLPILEAMACGTPVLTRRIGHVPETYNGENMFIHDGQPDDVAAIKTCLEDIFNDGKKAEEVRDKAWGMAKNYSVERRAYLYKRAYRQLMGDTPISVIYPIANRPDTIRQSFSAICQQTHKNIEIIVADDGDNYELVEDLRDYTNLPVVYLNTGRDDEYGLARARNEAITEATSDVLVFCDERVVMSPTAVEEFVKNLAYRSWIYGDKGFKKDFVENFSCCYRQELIELGMFNERCEYYGAMSQEIRARIRKNGWQTPYIENAKAKLYGKSSNRYRKRNEIVWSKDMLYKLGLD